MNESKERLRIEAIRKYLAGDPPSLIPRSLGRSNYWFFKWRSRFKSGEDSWGLGIGFLYQFSSPLLKRESPI